MHAWAGLWAAFATVKMGEIWVLLAMVIEGCTRATTLSTASLPGGQCEKTFCARIVRLLAQALGVAGP